MTLEDDTFIRDRLGHAVGQRIGVLYADYGLIGLRDPGCLQGVSTVLIGLFL